MPVKAIVILLFEEAGSCFGGGMNAENRYFIDIGDNFLEIYSK